MAEISGRSAAAEPIPERHLGLGGATLIGISAMLGAGIFVLTGVGFRVAGPAALFSFGLSGALAFVTAFSFAELSSAFPESGGSYVFAKRVFPIAGAFAAGWVLWLAYVVAAVLYALGFGAFLGMACEGLGRVPPAWVVSVGGVGALVVGSASLLRGGSSAGRSVTIAKLVAFAVLLVPGLALVLAQPVGKTVAALQPMFPHGQLAVLTAMTFTFIALEGFEVIASVAGEVRAPTRTLPRAMFLAIGITLACYLCLLLVLLVVGGSGESPAWEELGALGEQAVAVGAQRYLGKAGLWVVVIGGLLATFTALSSALLAASRSAHSMAVDRALPRPLGRLSGKAKSPRTALLTSLALAVVLVLTTGDVEVAGALASLIFLLSFALTNGAGLLVRVRGGVSHDSFKAPLYPVLPLVGITGCLALAVVQVKTVPLATVLGGSWLVLGLILYQLSFRARAETLSARAEALDTDLIRLRGREPLVLVPIARPGRAETLTELAHALAPPEWGRVVALTVSRHAADATPADVVAAYEQTTSAMSRAVQVAARSKRSFEAIVRVESDAARGIAETIRERKPEILLMGMSCPESPESTAFLERVVANSSLDVAIFSAPEGFQLGDVRRILVPVAGGSGHDPLRARVLGRLERTRHRDVTLLRTVRAETERRAATENLAKLAEDIHASAYRVEVASDPSSVLLEHARQHDLVIIGLSRAPGTPLFGHVVRAVAAQHETPLLMIARTTR